jgi:hypothetical protein
MEIEWKPLLSRSNLTFKTNWITSKADTKIFSFWVKLSTKISKFNNKLIKTSSSIYTTRIKIISTNTNFNINKCFLNNNMSLRLLNISIYKAKNFLINSFKTQTEVITKLVIEVFVMMHLIPRIKWIKSDKICSSNNILAYIKLT